MNPEQQRVEELMKDRYKVIADYPASLCRIGDILEIVTSKFEIWRNCRYGGLIKIDVPTFPAIFKPLEWYEEREESDMPKFLRVGKNGIIREVHSYFLPIDKVQFFGGKIRSLTQYQPATESQYLNQNKNK